MSEIIRTLGKFNTEAIAPKDGKHYAQLINEKLANRTEETAEQKVIGEIRDLLSSYVGLVIAEHISQELKSENLDLDNPPEEKFRKMLTDPKNEDMLFLFQLQRGMMMFGEMTSKFSDNTLEVIPRAAIQKMLDGQCQLYITLFKAIMLKIIFSDIKAEDPNFKP